MQGRWKGIRRALGAPLSALMLLVGAAGPFLDVADLSPRTVVESRHDPASCSPAHDHTLCIQVGANHALPTPEDVRSGSAAMRVAAVLGAIPGGRSSVLADGHPTRAPPSV